MTITDEIELNRIRKKWAGEGTSTATEIRFLLSLVDSQAAGNTTVSTLIGYEAGLKEGQDSMRSRCIEKVKAIDPRFIGDWMGAKYVEVDRVIAALESVTIQEQEKHS